MNKDKMIAMTVTYSRAAVPSVIAMYAAGITDPKVLAYAFISAFIAPIWKSLDPKAVEFGKGSTK
jgi:hypothetical protein